MNCQRCNKDLPPVAVVSSDIMAPEYVCCECTMAALDIPGIGVGALTIELLPLGEGLIYLH